MQLQTSPWPACSAGQRLAPAAAFDAKATETARVRASVSLLSMAILLPAGAGMVVRCLGGVQDGPHNVHLLSSPPSLRSPRSTSPARARCTEDRDELRERAARLERR